MNRLTRRGFCTKQPVARRNVIPALVEEAQT